MSGDRPSGLTEGSGRAGHGKALKQMLSVRFHPPILQATRLHAEAKGISVSDVVREALLYYLAEDSKPVRPRILSSPQLTLGIGKRDRWLCHVQDALTRVNYMCCDGHRTPEDAAAHGALLAAQGLSAYARSLKPPAYGAIVLAKAAS